MTVKEALLEAKELAKETQVGCSTSNTTEISQYNHRVVVQIARMLLELEPQE